MAWVIKNWNDLFENAQSRKADKLRWVPVPNKHDGRGYRRITRHPRACEIYTAWNLILQVASKMPERGRLVDADGIELGAEDLSDATGFPAEVFSIAFEVLSSARIGWIYDDSESSHSQPTTSPLPPESTQVSLNGKKGSEEKSTAEADRSHQKPKSEKGDRVTPIHRELTDHFTERWKAKYGRKYPFRKVDGVKVAELLKATGGCVEDAKAVLDAYLADDDGFLNGHSLTLLLGGSQLPRFMAKARGATAVRTAAYQHREDN